MPGNARRIRVSSLLSPSYRDELERIVFFNPEQGKVEKPVVTLVSRYGVPAVAEQADTLRFHLRGCRDIQSLFALDETNRPAVLAGVVMFVRESLEAVLLLHLAVHEDYGSGGIHSESWVTPRLLATVRSACKRVRGITCLRLTYPHEIQVRLDRLSA